MGETYNSDDIFSDQEGFFTPESIPLSAVPGALRIGAKAADIAVGGPLVRGLMNAPASMPEAETQTALEPISFRKGLTKTSAELFANQEVAPPEALTQTGVGPLSPEYAGEILPSLVENALYPVSAKLMGGAARVGAGLVKTSAELFPSMVETAGRQLASETGGVGSNLAERLQAAYDRVRDRLRVGSQVPIADVLQEAGVPMAEAEPVIRQAMREGTAIGTDSSWTMGEAATPQRVKDATFEVKFGSRNLKISDVALSLLKGQGVGVGEPNTLLSWVRSKGGLWDPSLPGEVSALGSRESGIVGLVSKATGRPVDELASQAVSEGWLPEGSSGSDLLDALRSDIGAVRTGTGTRAIPAGANIDRETARQVMAEEAAAAPPPEVPKVQELPKYAGSINLERLDLGPDELRYINKVYDENQSLIDKMRRGTITLDQTKAQAEKLLADDLGETLKWRKGQALNAEQATAYRLNLATQTVRVGNVARRVAAGDNSSEALGELVEAIRDQLKSQAETSAVASEAGRALSAFRIPAGPVDMRNKYIERMLQAVGGREVTEDIARQIAVAAEDGPVAVTRFIRGMATPSLRDKIFEVWMNSLLTGPKTHLAKALSETTAFLMRFPEKAVSAGIEWGREAVTRAPRTRFFGELPAEVFGAWQGMKEGVKKALFGFINEMPAGGVQTVESQAYRPTAIGGTLGKIIRTPSRLLMTGAEFFKAVNYEAELHALAYRTARSEGLAGEALSSRMAEILRDPAPEMIAKAEGEGLYRVFQQPFGEYSAKVSKLRQIPGVSYIVPFMRTPLNLVKFGLERTPLNFFRIGYKAAKGETLEWSDELARAAIGSVVGAAVAEYALEGKITGGGPPQAGERETYRRLGWQPYSVKIGDRFYSYQRWEPAAQVLGMSADFAEIAQRAGAGSVEAKSLAAQIGASIAQNLTSKTYLEGISSALNAMDDPQRYGDQFIKNLSGTLVPTGAYQVSQAMDPTVRRSDDIFMNIKRRTPGLSEGVLPKLDLWGRPIVRESAGAEAFLPTTTSTIKRDPVDEEMAMLGMSVTTPKATLGGVRLTPEQHYDYLQLSGQRAKDKLDRIVSGSGWGLRTDEAKEKAIREAILDSREWARNQLFRAYPDLKVAVKAKMVKSPEAVNWLQD